MPVREVTPEEFLGGKPLVMAAQPFHQGLKRLARNKKEVDREGTPSAD